MGFKPLYPPSIELRLLCGGEDAEGTGTSHGHGLYEAAPDRTVNRVIARHRNRMEHVFGFI